MRRGFLLSMDVIVCSGLLITLALFLSTLSFTYSSPELRYQKMYFAGKDVMNIINDVSFGSLNSSYQTTLLIQGLLQQKDLNKTLMEVIGSLWASGNVTQMAYANSITQEVFDRLFSQKYGYELLINNQSIYRKNDTYLKYMSRSTSLISGYDVGKPLSGYAARAYLGAIERKSTTRIFAMNIGGVGYPHGGYWMHGYAPPDSVNDGPGQRGQAVDVMNFELPNDTIVYSATLTKSVCGATARHEVNLNGLWSTGTLGDYIASYNVTSRLRPGWNNMTLFMTDYNNVTNTYIYRDMAHNHPGNFITVTYETKDLGESQTGLKRFYADDDLGMPATYENIPFYVPGTSLDAVSARVSVRGLNSIAYMALNYKFNSSNPNAGVILNKKYADTTDKLVTYELNITANGTLIMECVSVANVTAIFNETFGTDVDGFTYLDDLYQSTTNPSEENGLWETNANCATGGCMNVNLNTVPDTSGPWSGGWRRNFTVTDSPQLVRVSFFWRNRVQNLDSSGNEYARIYTRNPLTGAQLLVDSRTGTSTGSGTYTYFLNISNGNYTIDAGCWLSDVSSTNEQSECWIDDFSVEAIYPATEETCTNLPTNGNVTLSNVFTDRTNVLGLYFDIRQPRRYAPSDPLHPNNHPDGCESSCTSDLTPTETDYYTYLAPAAYASDDASGFCEIYSDIRNDAVNSTYVEVQYSGGKQLGYGYVMITKIYPFTSVLGDNRPGTPYRAGTESRFFVLDFDVVEARLLGVQGPWGGRDNGYNFVFVQPDGGTERTALDTNMPPGSITYIPTSFFQRGRMNNVRVYDVQSGRELDITRSYVEVTYMIKMSVSYGDVFSKAQGSTYQVYYDVNQDGMNDGSTAITIGPNPADPFDPQDDAIDDALARLLDELNFIDDKNPGTYGNGTAINPYDGSATNPIDIDITPDIAIVTGYTGDVPSMWGPAIMEVRIWN